ncbi:MAG: HAD family hydrolase, partial [Rhodospirillales bacterium]|nr:HAD family hydrolase [Rhodospirillales bacterium]
MHNLRFALLVTRELGAFKPSPEPLLHACRTLDVAPTDTWMVGDGQFDVEAGLAAGAHTIWLSHGRAKRFPAEPHRMVADLHELTRLLQDCLDC